MTGYSPATVSNALNHKKNVSRETADKIVRTARKLGYFKDNSVTKLKLVLFRENGTIIDNTPFFPTLISHFEQESRQNGYETVLYNLDRRSENFENELDALLNDPECAIVLLATEMKGRLIERFRHALTPVVVLDNWTTDMGLDAVCINNPDSARMAAAYLIEQGHTHIGYIRSSFRIHNFRARHQGLERALDRAGLSLRRRDIVTVRPNTEGAYEDTLSWLREHQDLPTAFFADNDLMALGAMRAFQASGLRIPEDISVIGFDDLPFSVLSSPPLTTVGVDNGELGRAAVRRIVQRIKSRDEPQLKVEIATRFTVRDTVSTPAVRK